MNKLINKRVKGLLLYFFLLLLLFTTSSLLTKYSFDAPLKSESIVITQMLTGSVAPFGSWESLFLDSNGVGRFYAHDNYFGTTDSVEINIGIDQMRQLYDTVLAVGFFELDSIYMDTLTDDGLGASISVITGIRQKVVSSVNSPVIELDRLIIFVNTLLNPYGVKLSTTDNWTVHGGISR